MGRAYNSNKQAVEQYAVIVTVAALHAVSTCSPSQDTFVHPNAVMRAYRASMPILWTVQPPAGSHAKAVIFHVS